ncbi:unnamed protein product [Schistocephalus solidus]|uniref:Ubiquitin-like protease family profile domain-containing protein n=1 Tax=Schistocephalus solidus TaxID=70667 RepID=A0A3P7CSR2_SCHSO|nr:unnamed protein product [Schistocephalus solidus]
MTNTNIGLGPALFNVVYSPEGGNVFVSDLHISQTMIKCSTPNCAGFSYSSGVACTVCNQIIKPTSEFADEITSQTKVEQVGAKRRLLEQPIKNVSCSPQSTFSYPLVVLSIAKVGVFDARQKPCIISSRDLSFSFYDEGIRYMFLSPLVTWIPVRISAEEVNCIMFCERIQVIFLRPTEALMRKLLKQIRSTATSRNTESHIEHMASDPTFCISDSPKSSDATSEKDVQAAVPTSIQVLNEDLVILTDDGAPTVPPTELKSTSTDCQAPNGFVYRPPGSSDGILLTTEDVACLTPGSFLNDTIINFYLKYLFFEQLSAFQRQATHLFNCFFYSRLSSTPAPSAAVPNCPTDNANPDQLRMARHSNVAKWTRRVDLFSKDYIIIPINENLHWFLGLVCYPWMAGMVSYTKLYEAFAFDLCQLNPEFVDVDHIHVGQVDIGQEELTVLPTDKKGEAFDRWRRRRLAWLRRRGINAMPCILLFDSIPSHSRVSNLHVIRNYLQAEWNVRRSERDGPLYFNKDTIRGFSPRVPSQSNLVDCGIFLLHYVEMFFRVSPSLSPQHTYNSTCCFPWWGFHFPLIACLFWLNLFDPRMFWWISKSCLTSPLFELVGQT